MFNDSVLNRTLRMHSAVRTPFVILAAILLGLALPSALKEKSWLRLLIASALSFFVVVLPVFVFLLSAFMVPEWKGGCHLGWFDCFHMGKLALTPIVFWATAALYAVEICQIDERMQPWIVQGLFLGAIVASVCFVFGLVSVGNEKGASLWLLVPFYISLWHGIRAVQLIKSSKLGLASYVRAVCGSLPLWFVGAIWSRKVYESLPNNPPSCFVVTAASRGHERFVGPFVETTHNGRARLANQQLITLWQFEHFWRNRAPRSHAAFRRVYNRVGPFLARRIDSPWLADAACLAIKPVEFMAALVIRMQLMASNEEKFSLRCEEANRTEPAE
jgi:hypothetical protein